MILLCIKRRLLLLSIKFSVTYFLARITQNGNFYEAILVELLAKKGVTQLAGKKGKKDDS